MTNEIDNMQKRIGEILPMQGWVELHGAFTVAELGELILKINQNYEGPKKGNKD